MNLNHNKSREPHLATFLLALLFLSIFTAGCSTTKSETPPEVPTETASTAPAPEASAPSPESETNKLIHLEALGVSFLESVQSPPPIKSIEAKGFGLPSSNAGNTAQKQLTAMEAARYRALANLVEKRDGLEVLREAHTVDMAFAGEEIHVRINGTLKGVSEVAQDYDAESEMATVTLKMLLEPEPDAMHKKTLTLEQRKARAITAARIQATASLREQIGQIYVEQDVLVEELILAHQQARVYVQGLLEGVSFSEALWLGESRCEVVASLEVNQTDMEKMTQSTPRADEQEVQ